MLSVSMGVMFLFARIYSFLFNHENFQTNREVKEVKKLRSIINTHINYSDLEMANIMYSICSSSVSVGVFFPKLFFSF